MNHQKNAKYERTDRRIREVFLDIVNEGKSPTVSEIVKRIGINRTTFYLHYATIIDLFDAVKENVYAEVASENARLAEAGDPEMYFRSRKSYLIFARHVKKHQAYYRQFFRVHTTFPIEDGYAEIKELLRDHFEKRGITNKRVIEERFICYQAAFTHCLKNWVDNDCDLSEETIADILVDCAAI